MDEQIIRLSNQFGFKCVDFFGNIKIYSKNDIWYIKIASREKIRLYHYNKFYNSNNRDFHFQCELNSMDHLFKYIHKHDGKYKYPSWSETYYKKLYAKLA